MRGQWVPPRPFLLLTLTTGCRVRINTSHIISIMEADENPGCQIRTVNELSFSVKDTFDMICESLYGEPQ